MTKNTAAKPFVFTLMPFHETFNDIWNFGIKKTCEDAGAYCERVDEQIFEERMLDRIYNQINKADIIVADMKGKNPNVFYEVGYDHALNKKVLLIIQDEHDIPFDLKHHPFIIYKNSISNLKKALAIKLDYFISNPDIEAIPEVNEIDFYSNGVKIEEGNNIVLLDRTSGSSYFNLQIDILNNSTKVYNDLKVGLICESIFIQDLNDDLTVTVLPDKRKLHLNPNKYIDFYPSAFEKISFMPAVVNLIEGETLYPFTLRTFGILGINDINFFITLNYLIKKRNT